MDSQLNGEFLEKIGSPNHRDVITTLELLRSGIGDRFAQLPEGHLLRQNVAFWANKAVSWAGTMGMGAGTPDVTPMGAGGGDWAAW